MKRLLVAPLAMSAGPVFAHGGHPPAPEAVHALAHAAAPFAAILLIGFVLSVGWLLSGRRD